MALISVLFIGVVVGFFSFNKSNSTSKKSILAGYADGSIIDYRFMMYEDSTYYLSTIDSKIGDEHQNEWLQIKDTIFLKMGNNIGAKLIGNRVVEYTDPQFKSLTIMQIKKFDPPKNVEFPR